MNQCNSFFVKFMGVLLSEHIDWWWVIWCLLYL